jgi:uncharacterized protein YbbC (DUF1343 family)
MLTITKIMHNFLFVLIFLGCSPVALNTGSDKKLTTNSDAIINTGLDILLEKHIDNLYENKIALVTNHSGIDKNGISNISRFITQDSINLVKIFTPEHGLAGLIPDGEIIEGDSSSQLLPPIISLYGNSKKPTLEMYNDIDLIIYDIQDVGARFYTYISTLGLVMETAGEANIPVIVLDRPNPIGGDVNGPILKENYKSFVGKYPIPIQYGMTVGELAKMIVGEEMITPTPILTVIPMENYNRNLYYDETNLPWTNPSPNIPDLETAIIYPGLCLIEATNVSEGRGTYSPFKQIGAPWIDADSLMYHLNKQNLPGVIFEPGQFTPMSIPTMSKYPKHKNEICNGIELNITNRDNYNSILTGITLLWAIYKLYPNELIINKESMGRLWGSDNLFQLLQDGKIPLEIIKSYQTELEQFLQIRKKYLIYD